MAAIDFRHRVNLRPITVEVDAVAVEKSIVERLAYILQLFEL